MIEEALIKIKNYFEWQNIHYNEKIIQQQAEEWYFYSDVANADMIAACVIEYGHYDPAYQREAILEAYILFKGTYDYLELKKGSVK